VSHSSTGETIGARFSTQEFFHSEAIAWSWFEGTRRVRPMGHQSSGVGVPKLMFEFKASASRDLIKAVGQREIPETKSSNGVLSPRRDCSASSSASTSKSFLNVGTRVAPSSRQFKNTLSRIPKGNGKYSSHAGHWGPNDKLDRKPALERFQAQSIWETAGQKRRS
jgi:hypothetical protein